MSLLVAALLSVGCAQLAQAPIVVGFAPAVARRGAVLALEVSYIDGPGGTKPVPRECLSDWRVAGKDVKLDRRRGQLRIGAKAVVGEQATLSFLAGGPRVSRNFIVRGEDEPVLAGRWILADGACHLFPYVELVFSEDGKLTYTSPERMVESMSDGTLPYEWLADAGVIRSTLFAGGGTTASVRGDELQMQPMRGCNLRFERR